MQDIVHCLYYLYCPLVLKYRRYIDDLNQREISVLDRTSHQFLHIRRKFPTLTVSNLVDAMATSLVLSLQDEMNKFQEEYRQVKRTEDGMLANVDVESQTKIKTYLDKLQHAFREGIRTSATCLLF